MTLQETLAPSLPPITLDMDGVMRVGGTRVTLDTVIAAYKEGADAEQIALQYDALQLADIHAVISHYLRHRAEVEEYLKGRQAQADRVRADNQKRFPNTGVRERLLARRNGRP
jgi:uncharacterized protein (DUF433 family)